MKNLKQFISLSFIATLFILTACNSDTTDNNLKVETPDDNSTINTRSFNTKIAAEAYYYKSLATFENGAVKKMQLDDLANLQGIQINLVVLYEADAPWADAFNGGRFETTGNDKLNALMEAYELEIIKQFAIDDKNEGIVLEAQNTLEAPAEAARQLSLIDNVLAVQIKEIPQQEDPVSAAN